MFLTVRRIFACCARSGFDFSEFRGDLEPGDAFEPPQIERRTPRIQDFERPDGTQFLNDDLAMSEPIFELFVPLDQGTGGRQFGRGIVRIGDWAGLGAVHGGYSFVKVHVFRVLSIFVPIRLLLGGDDWVDCVMIARLRHF